MDFKALGLIAPILKALAAQGYAAPSPIQEKAIPPALAGRDVLGCAQTGTGKTCAFAAPILQRLNGVSVSGRPIRALVLTPTRELALQIWESFEAYGKELPIRSAVIFGGVGQAPQVSKLKRGVDVLVATPGRLLDLQGQGLIDLSGLEVFVLDEADRMLDMGFIHDVRRILRLLPAKKQTLFFSATMPPEVASLVEELLKNPVRIAADPVSSPVEAISQWVYPVDRSNKTKLLAKLVGGKEVTSALVFTRTKHGANKVSGELQKMGIRAAAIHGNKSQSARQQALAEFKDGRLRVLVATDIAARGLDIEELSHVFNYNLPDVPETYIHRIGRTGRAGRGGTAISFCDFSEKPLLKSIEALLGRRIAAVDDPDWPMKVFEVPVKDTGGRAVNAEDAEARAAAKQRRRTRAAEYKAEAEKKTKKTAPPAPGAAPGHRQEHAKKQRRPEKEKASAAIAESAAAALLEQERRPDPSGEFRRPDPLAGSAVMDATARLLAPKRRPAAPQPSTGREPSNKRSGTPKNQQARQTSRKKAAPEHRSGRPAASKGPQTAGRHGLELRNTRQKDSTEQPSLMKPYYLERD